MWNSAAPLILSFLLISEALGATAAQYLAKPPEWFKTAEAATVADNILSWQQEDGDWPKNGDTVSTKKPADLKTSGTFDNRATIGELRFLGKAFNATQDERYQKAFFKGFDLILSAQYPNGGWPQSYPPGNGYARHITFNDDTFVGLAEFTRDASASPDFAFIPPERRADARKAYERAIRCVVQTQIRSNGDLTVWCAQHDAATLEPQSARTYELVSLSGAESAGLLRFLMRVEKPDADIQAAVHAGVRWFENVKLKGIRVVRENGERRVVEDASAPPLWARFYELGTNRPMFSGRDGQKKYSMAEIEAERRNGYAWYGNWGQAVFADYEKWQQRLKSK